MPCDSMYGTSAYATLDRMTPASMWTRSFSTSLRAFVSAAAGCPSLSSSVTSILRPAACQPVSCQYSSQPLYMSLPAAAMAPDSGEMKPILIGPCADASQANTTTSDAASTSLTTRMSASSDRLASDGGAPAPRNPMAARRGYTRPAVILAARGDPMEIDRPLPNPMTPEAKPYWDGLREQKLMLPKCHARDIGWIQSTGRGTLHAFEIGYQSFNKAFKVPAPYVLAMIELAEGPRMLSNLVNVEPDPKTITCDMPVEVVFSKLTDEITLPLFQPVR